MSGIRAHTSAAPSADQNVNLDVSALFDDLSVQLRSEPKSLSKVRQADYLLFKADFQKLVTKGASLYELMIAEPTGSAQNNFTSVQDLQKWGYDKYESNDQFELRCIDSVLNIIGVSDSPMGLHSPNIPVGYAHKHPVIFGDTLFPATSALLCQVINPSDGIIVAYDNITAQGVDAISGRKGSPVPHLHHWSDIAYLQWLSKADPDSNLRFILRYNVLNDLTCFASNFMSSHYGLALTKWPGTTYHAESAQFNALLGSPNGRGVAYLLIQHQEQIGHKIVEKVTVFGTCRETMLLFHVQNAKEKSGLDESSKAALESVKQNTKSDRTQAY